MASRTIAGICTFDGALVDGTVIHVRPIRPDDAEDLIAFHEDLSPETVYRRFFNPHPHLSAEEARRFSTVDFRNRVALVATVDQTLVAVARFDRQDGTDAAEVAFVVADAFQGRGLGPLLLRALVDSGRQLAVRRFAADILFGNRAMRDLIRDCGFPLSESLESGIVHVEFPIEA